MSRKIKDAPGVPLRKIMASWPKPTRTRIASWITQPLELLVATARCTDQRVPASSRQALQKYRSAADYARMPLPELEQDIERQGFIATRLGSEGCGQALVGGIT